MILSLNKEYIKLKLNTGAEVNVIPYSIDRKVAKTSKIEWQKPKGRLRAYIGENIPIKAVCTLQCQHKGTIHDLYFFITSINSEPVFSISACKKLGLIKFIGAVDCKKEDVAAFTTRIKKEYKAVCTGIGCLDCPHHIELESTVQPVIIPSIRIPFGLEDRVKAALLDMCTQSIIVPVDQPNG